MGNFIDFDDMKSIHSINEALKELILTRSLMHVDFGFEEPSVTQNNELEKLINEDIDKLNDIAEAFLLKNEQLEKTTHVKRSHPYHLKKNEKDELVRLQKINPSLVWEHNGELHRQYRRPISKFFKKVSNKEVRRYKGSLGTKSNTYRKVFDFWWTLD